MFYTKYPHQANFSFATEFDNTTGELHVNGRKLRCDVDSYAGGIYRLQMGGLKAWEGRRRLVEMLPPPEEKGHFEFDPEGRFQIKDAKGKLVLQSARERAVGLNGDKWMIRLEVGPDTRYYGMGEKTFGRLELSGVRTKFWNTDVWADFHAAQYLEHPVDPTYVSIPYVILKHDGRFIGILAHSGHPVFMETPGEEHDVAFAEFRHTGRQVVIGAEGGAPDLWFIVGPTLQELTRKLQGLVGNAPLPPLWSMGYHQCRWGYKGEADLLELDRKFTEHDIPCDGLWIDIDYMDGYRVFTTSPEHFPHGLAPVSKTIREHGRRIVPILDPGVKFEKGNLVYDSGHAKNIFCLNREGREFIGLVWPGETVFPDYTLKEARDWWAEYAKEFIESGFHAAWVDMNDPACGPVDPSDFLFNHGREAHEEHRNDYALGMQMATRQGFLEARPNERPFVLSRSGSVGTSRVSAIWSGDNYSNYFYLKNSLPLTMNLGLSGICYNAPDVGGFGGTRQTN